MNTHTFPHRGLVPLAAVAVIVALSSPLGAQTRRADDPPVPPLAEAAVASPETSADKLVTYLDNEITNVEDDYVVVRCAFAIGGKPGRWYRLDVEFRLSQTQPLITPAGQSLVKEWNNLFTPHGPTPTRWLDCRLDVDLADLETASNLPKGKSFVLWAMGLVYDWADRNYVGSGWSVRAPLLVTTDAGGKVIKVVAPRLLPMGLLTLSPVWSQTVQARKAELKLQHLTPKADTLACIVSRREQPPVRVLAREETQAWQPQGYGWFVSPIDTADKARELLELQMPSHVILRTREQYDAIVETLQKLGWARGRDILTAPPVFSDAVTPVEGLGYRLRQVSVDPVATDAGEMLGDIVYRDIYVTTDGRIGFDSQLCLRAPEPPKNEPGWTQIAPSDPAAYSQAVRDALTDDGHRIIDKRFQPTDDIVPLRLPVEAPENLIDTPKEPAVATTQPAEPTTQPATEPTTQPAEPTTQPDTATTQPAVAPAEDTPSANSTETDEDISDDPTAPPPVPTVSETDESDEKGRPDNATPEDAQPAEPSGALRPKSSTLAQLIGKKIADVRRKAILALPPAAIDDDFNVDPNYTGDALCETSDDGRYVLDFHKGVLRGLRKKPDDEK